MTLAKRWPTAAGAAAWSSSRRWCRAGPAWTARWLYGERYAARLADGPEDTDWRTFIRYWWRVGGS